jgi:integrase
VTEGLVAEDPMAGLPRPRVAREETERDVDPVTPAMLEALLNVCPAWTWLGQRDRAIVRMLWDTPLRASELCGLLVTDIDWDAMEVRVRDGKGGCRYEALITEDLGLAISRYLRNRRHDCAVLFVTQDGSTLSPHALGQLLQRLSRKAGIAPHVFPHQFRHSFRVRMRALGLDDCDVSALLGHRSVVPTWGYGRRQARIMAKARLRERLAG